MCRLVSTRTICTAALLLTANGWSLAQTLKVRPPSEPDAKQAQQDDAPQAPEASPVTVAMSVPSGTPIKVALDSEVRIRNVGQPIHGKTTEPVYAFDKLLIPVGTPVSGTVSAIDAVPKKTRTLEAMDGNFSPVRRVHVQFDELILADGRHFLMHTVASPSPGGILRFVPASEKPANTNPVHEAASKKVGAVRQQIRQSWADLQKAAVPDGKTGEEAAKSTPPGQ